jgi:anti-anti-sigma factor
MPPLVHIIEIIGKLEIPMGKEIINTMYTIVESSPEIVLLDLQKVTFVDSGGLGAIVRAFKTSETAGIRFVICTDQPEVIKILKLTAINQTIEIFNNKENFYTELKQEIPEYSYLTNFSEISISLGYTS